LWLCGGPSVVALLAWDATASAPVPRDAGPDDENGRGLAIVAGLSASWGFYYPASLGGKVTWAIIDSPLRISTGMNIPPEPKEGNDMTGTRCSCGFAELGDETIADHLHLVFTPDDMRGKDGLVHEEGQRLACLCGFTARTPDELGEHFLTAFTPDDAIGRDGKAHATDGGARERTEHFPVTETRTP
jgi:hypothetical protein